MAHGRDIDNFLSIGVPQAPKSVDLSRTLELAAAALDDHDEPIMQSPRGSRVIPNRQCLAAVAVLGEREVQLSAVQRLAEALFVEGACTAILTNTKALYEMHQLLLRGARKVVT